MNNTIPLGPFLGMNNKLPDSALHTEKGDYLSLATDVLVDSAGRLRSIDAFSLAQEAPGAHSLFMLTDTTGYVVRSGVLFAITLPAYTETLFKVLTTDDPLSYRRIGDDLYYSNGTDSGRITGGVWYPLGLPTPAAPTLSAVNGTLYAGNYQVSVSYCNTTTGEESGISPSTVAVLPGIGGLRVSLPAAVIGATHVVVYLSPVNGSIPLRVAQVAAGAAYVDFTAPPTNYGRQITGRIESPLPPGDLFESNGRLCSISGNTVYVGLPYKHGYYEPGGGSITFLSPVTMAVANEGGTYIAADKTYFVPGDLGNAQDRMTDALPFGAVRGTAFAHPDKKGVGWFSPEGFVLADTTGQAVAITADTIALTPPERGTSSIITQGAERTVVSCGWLLNLGNNAVVQNAYGLTSFSRGYGTTAAGIVRQDDGVAPIGTACLGKVDFGTDRIKNLPTVYAGVSAVDSLVLTVKYVDGQDRMQEYEYLARSSSENLRIQRFDVGRGMRGTWFELTLSNQDGQKFELTAISFAPAASSRRI